MTHALIFKPFHRHCLQKTLFPLCILDVKNHDFKSILQNIICELNFFIVVLMKESLYSINKYDVTK